MDFVLGVGTDIDQARNQDPARNLGRPVEINITSPAGESAVKSTAKRNKVIWTGSLRKQTSHDIFQLARLEAPIAAADAPTDQPRATSSSLVQAAAQPTEQRPVGEQPTVAVPSFYNPNAVNASRVAQQLQKRKLLWSHKVRRPLGSRCVPARTNRPLLFTKRNRRKSRRRRRPPNCGNRRRSARTRTAR